MGSSGVLRRPAVPPPVRIRRNIKNLADNDPIVVFYGKAIAAMRKIPLKESSSWRYQAAIHDYPPRNPPPGSPDRRPFDERRRDEDPFFSPGDVFPSDEATFWRQCQHQSWFFLPWHRVYLHHFEKIIISTIAQMEGAPKDWALPYWNWDAPEGPGRLPTALRGADGSANPLFVGRYTTARGAQAEGRDPRANRGQQFAFGPQLDIRTCLTQPNFQGTGASGEFGGPPVRRHDQFDRVDPLLDGVGTLEGTPHGSMHMAVGSPPLAFMRSFTRAPLDPVFWLHHCNVDRLWEVWIQRDPAHVNPTDPAWLNEVFKFHDATGGNGDMTPRQVLNTRTPPLSYEYDDTSDPLAAGP